MSAEDKERYARMRDGVSADTSPNETGSEPGARTARSCSPEPNEVTRTDGWDADRLAEAVGRAVLGDPHSAVWRDARSAAWLAGDDFQAAEREARRELRREERVASDVLALGRELQARGAARRLAVSRRDGHPEEIAPLIRGTPARVLEHALEHDTTPSVHLAVAAGVGRDLWEEPCDTWIKLPDGVPSARYIALKISGDSMAPLMHTGDTILVRLGVPLRKDNVIVARHPDDGYVCKVVHRIRSATIELASLDPARPLVTIPRDERLIVGTVMLVWCSHRGNR
jgi:phage repressor protein C with HTH and peptisase S24 domain